MTFKQNQHFNFVTFVFSLFILLNFQRVISSMHICRPYFTLWSKKLFTVFLFFWCKSSTDIPYQIIHFILNRKWAMVRKGRLTKTTFWCAEKYTPIEANARRLRPLSGNFSRVTKRAKSQMNRFTLCE